MIPMNTMMSTMMVITKTTMTINTQVASGVFTALPTALDITPLCGRIHGEILIGIHGTIHGTTLGMVATA